MLKYSFKCPESLGKRLEDFRYGDRQPTMTAAILALLETGLAKAEKKLGSPPNYRRGGRR